jgi:hypothetical protein
MPCKPAPLERSVNMYYVSGPISVMDHFLPR